MSLSVVSNIIDITPELYGDRVERRLLGLSV